MTCIPCSHVQLQEMATRSVFNGWLIMVPMVRYQLQTTHLLTMAGMHTHIHLVTSATLLRWINGLSQSSYFLCFSLTNISVHGVVSVSLRNSTGETPKDVARRFTRMGCLAVLGGGTAGWLANNEIMYCYTHSLK